MVIEDFRVNPTKSISPPNNSIQIERLAQPLDRFAAFIVDHFIILSPLLLLINAPYKKWFYRGLILEENYLLAQSVFITAIISFIFIFLYKVITTYFWGATFGKKFLGVQVESVWRGKKPSILNIMMRELSWWMGLFTFGFSYLSIFTNEKRRAFHDRVSDTIVVTKKNKFAVLPSLYESSVVRGFVFGVMGFLAIVVLVLIHKTQSNLAISSHITKILEEKGELCQTIGDEIDNFNFVGGTTTRIETAMALFSASIIDDTCLEKETNYLFKHDVQEPIMYLAKSFLYKDKPKLSDSYLERVCWLNINSPECHLSKILNAWDKEDWSKVQSLFGEVKKEWPIYMHIWAIKNSILSGNFTDVNFHLQAIPELEVFKSFKTQYHLKTKLAYKTANEIDKYMDVIEAILPSMDSQQLNGWICHNQLNDSCEYKDNFACAQINTMSNETEDLYTSLSQLKINYCLGNNSAVEVLRNREVKKLAQSINKISTSKTEAERELLRIYRENKYRNLIKEEAGKYFLTSASDEATIREFVLVWKTQHKMYEWIKTGKNLFDKLIKLQSWDLAAEVGMSINDKYEKNISFQNDLILALFYSGSRRKAWEMTKKFQTQDLQRAPASLETKPDILMNELKKEFGSQ